MEYVNSKGVKYYLHFVISIIGRNRVSVDTYFFTKDKNGKGYPCSLPDKFVVKETRTGLPVIKKLC